MVDDFIDEMGARNFLIMNALRKQKEDREVAQRVTPEAAEPGAQAERPPPPPVRIQQLDGTASSTPTRSKPSPQLYEDEDYEEE
jgi:hypothetical protein